MTSNQSIEFYWRPGCGFCMMLERSLSEANVPLNKHNIWEDPAAAEFVRSVNNGNETVPTVKIGDRTFTNPSPTQVLESLQAS